MHAERLFVFDMDGTLLPETTAMLEIAKLTGHLDEVLTLEKKYVQKEIQGDTFTRSIWDMWKTWSPETVQEAFQKAPKLKNIKTVLNTIAEEGGLSCLITSSQDFFAHHFYEYGFDFIFASHEYCFKTQEISTHRSLEAKHKLAIAQNLCKKLELPFLETVAFGDSLSDIDLFTHLVHTVSVNGNHHISDIAAHHYKGRDLMEAFELVTQLQKM